MRKLIICRISSLYDWPLSKNLFLLLNQRLLALFFLSVISFNYVASPSVGLNEYFAIFTFILVLSTRNYASFLSMSQVQVPHTFNCLNAPFYWSVRVYLCNCVSVCVDMSSISGCITAKSQPIDYFIR